MNFTPSQIEALEISAKHWRKNLEYAKNEDIDLICIKSNTCECCSRFYNTKDDFMGVCAECPISQYSECTGCECTPWTEVRDLLGTYSYRKNVPIDKIIEAVEEECEFLEALARGEDPMI